MGTGFSLLYRRQGIYRFRRVVPKELRDIIGVREIKVSLRTSDPDEAKRRAAREAVKADQRIAEARRILANPAARSQRIVQEHEDAHRRRPRTGVERGDEAVVIADALERESDPIRIRAFRSILKKLNAPTMIPPWARTPCSPSSSTVGVLNVSHRLAHGWSRRRRASDSSKSRVVIYPSVKSPRLMCGRSRHRSWRPPLATGIKRSLRLRSKKPYRAAFGAGVGCRSRLSGEQPGRWNHPRGREKGAVGVRAAAV